jgi:hypothetical protein
MLELHGCGRGRGAPARPYHAHDDLLFFFPPPPLQRRLIRRPHHCLRLAALIYPPPTVEPPPTSFLSPPNMEPPKTRNPNAGELVSGDGGGAHGLRGASGELVFSNGGDAHGLWGAYKAWAMGTRALRSTRLPLDRFCDTIESGFFTSLCSHTAHLGR